MNEKSVEVTTAVIRDDAGVPVAVAAAVAPTQERHPNRATARTVFQMLLALAVLWPLIVGAAGLPEWTWIGGSLALAAGVTRVMALPGVEAFLRSYLPFLSAAPKPA